MAIQFSCQACRKLIEVDDELAARLAVCPYCQATVRVPVRAAERGESAPQPAPQAGPVPESEPIAPREFEAPATGGSVPGAFPRTAPLRGNPLGNWGLGVSILGWLAMGAMTGYILVQVASSPLLQERADPTAEEVQQVLRDIAEDPDKARVMALGGGMMTLCAATGCVLSVLALLKREVRKGTAIAGLVVGGTLLACQCMSIFTGFPTGGS